MPQKEVRTPGAARLWPRQNLMIDVLAARVGPVPTRDVRVAGCTHQLGGDQMNVVDGA